MKFTKGYDAVRERVAKGSRYTMSCYNCEYFYQDFGDKEEVCQNSGVLKYDMVVTPTNIYCNKWKMTKRQSKTSFKGGASINGFKKKKLKKAEK